MAEVCTLRSTFARTCLRGLNCYNHYNSYKILHQLVNYNMLHKAHLYVDFFNKTFTMENNVLGLCQCYTVKTVQKMYVKTLFC